MPAEAETNLPSNVETATPEGLERSRAAPAPHNALGRPPRTNPFP